MLRLLVLIHRYLGIAIGILLLAWCLSGFVMMYVQYPYLSQETRLLGLPPINLQDCCQFPTDDLGEQTVDYFKIEMLNDSPVIRLGWYPNEEIGVDLRSSEWLYETSEQQAQAIANTFSHYSGRKGEISYLGSIVKDQWTVSGSYAQHSPMHHFSIGDTDSTKLYISNSTGEVVLVTTEHQRFWNWIGSVTHWLYFTKFRENHILWTNTIIWTSIIGVFLTVIGVYIGISKYKFKSNRKIHSPYKGWALWHHYIGLTFGLFTLTWVLSGLFSMAPYGFLAGTWHQEESTRLRGKPMSWQEVGNIIDDLSTKQFPKNIKMLEVNTLLGEPALITYNSADEIERFNIGTLEPEAINDRLWSNIAAVIRPNTTIKQAEWLTESDSYYYQHHTKKRFPVYRIIVDDAEQTRYYLDTVSGKILTKLDGDRQWSRWLFGALHRGDFSAFVRTRPIWDLFMLFLLTGVTLVCGTGCWMGLKSVFK